MVSSTYRPHFTPGKDPVPILQEVGWATGPVWTDGKSRPYRDSIPDRPAGSQSLYRLGYRAHTHYIYTYIYIYMCVFSCGTTAILGHRPPQTQTICRTPLDEGSAHRGGIYLTTHTTHTRQTSMPPAGFDYGTPESERPQTHAVDGAAIRIGTYSVYLVQNSSCTAVRSTVTAPVKIKSGIMYCRAHDSH